ncbi:hypothetical protein Hanom_Chr00s024111g01763371 [Helianthus anomalus]
MNSAYLQHSIRLWDMGRGLGRGLAINVQVTTPGGPGFGRDLLGGSLRLGVGRGYEGDMAGCHWPTKLAVWASRWGFKKKNFFSI